VSSFVKVRFVVSVRYGTKASVSSLKGHAPLPILKVKTMMNWLNRMEGKERKICMTLCYHRHSSSWPKYIELDFERKEKYV
jgi:hypothetical protein